MSESNPNNVFISKGNCGVPQFQGAEIVYSGTTDVMAAYAGFAVAAGARIVGGCCGTSPAHLAAMRHSIDTTPIGERPTLESIVTEIGPLTNAAPSATAAPGTRGERGRRRAAE